MAVTTLLLSRAGDLRRRLRDCCSGVAVTEFALSLPVLLTLGLAGMETAWLMLAHLRISNIAMMTADGASRVRDSIDEADINELFTGATAAGSSIGFQANGRIILYSVEPDSTNTKQWIRWQRCIGGLTSAAPSYGRPMKANGTLIKDGTESAAAPNGSSPTSSTMTAIGPAGNQIQAQPGTATLIAEVVYNYQPLVSGNLLGPITIRYTSAFNVRQRTDQVLHNIAAVTPKACN